MKTEYEIREEIKRLENCIYLRQGFLNSIFVDNDSKKIYKIEIKEMQGEVERLKWVLG